MKPEEMKNEDKLASTGTVKENAQKQRKPMVVNYGYCLGPSSLRAEDCLFFPDYDWDSTYWDDR